MSKCGLCGEDFGSGSHQILECRAKRVIPKSIYIRSCSWMAYADEPEMWYAEFHEDFEHGMGDKNVPYDELGPVTQKKVAEAAEVYLKEEAMDIMYEIHKIYNGDENK